MEEQQTTSPRNQAMRARLLKALDKLPEGRLHLVDGRRIVAGECNWASQPKLIAQIRVMGGRASAARDQQAIVDLLEIINLVRENEGSTH